MGWPALADLAKVSVSHRTKVGGWAGLAYAAIEPCYAGGRAEPRRAERMKRRRDVIMALAVRERKLSGQTRKGCNDMRTTWCVALFAVDRCFRAATARTQLDRESNRR